MMLAWKIGPALAAGCSVILKPSRYTPLASLEVAYLAKEAGIPAGVINMITGNVGDQYTMTPEYKVVAVDFEKV